MVLSKAAIPDILRKQFPILTDLALREEISEVGRVMSFDAGEVILDYGQYVKLMPLVIEGSIKVSHESEDGSEIFLYYLTGGDSCTMTFTCCMNNKQSVIRTIAEEDTTIIAIPSRYMDEWIMKYRSWKDFVMTAYDSRMLELLHTFDQIIFKQLDERLLQYLHKRAKATHSDVIPATHQSIAEDLNVSRESVSRTLKVLEKKGEVILGRNKVELIR